MQHHFYHRLNMQYINNSPFIICTEKKKTSHRKKGDICSQSTDVITQVVLKEIVHPEIKFSWKWLRQVKMHRYRQVYFFIGTDLTEKLHHLLTNGCHRMRVQRADKNITIIQKVTDTTPVLWSKKLLVCNKQIHDVFCNFKPVLLAKMWFLIHKIANIPVKILSESGEKYAQIKHWLAKTVQGSIVIDYGLIFWPEVTF